MTILLTLLGVVLCGIAILALARASIRWFVKRESVHVRSCAMNSAVSVIRSDSSTIEQKRYATYLHQLASNGPEVLPILIDYQARKNVTGQGNAERDTLLAGGNEDVAKEIKKASRYLALGLMLLDSRISLVKRFVYVFLRRLEQLKNLESAAVEERQTILTYQSHVLGESYSSPAQMVM